MMYTLAIYTFLQIAFLFFKAFLLHPCMVLPSDFIDKCRKKYAFIDDSDNMLLDKSSTSPAS